MTMRLIEVEQLTIYCDLDGVLVDFVKRAQELVPEFQSDSHPVDKETKKLHNKLWKIVGGRAKRGEMFWGEMDPLPDAFELWNYIGQYEPKILSATGSVGNAVQEKHQWVKDHLGDEVIVHLVQKAADKAQFATPTRILIDDKMKAITPWLEAGGIGVFHTSAEDTIKQLKELGL
jgi:hypothetical protein